MNERIADFCKENSKIYIFGNGSGGENVAAYLDYFNIKYEGIIISKGYEKGEGGSHSVFYLSEIVPDDKTGIILGCAPVFYNEVVSEIVKSGWKNLFFGVIIFGIGYAIRKLRGLGVDFVERSA